MAYNEGHKKATKDLTDSYNNSTMKMKNALDKIKDTLESIDWIEYPDPY